ncbi:hypothetical protein BASA82_000869 [Batrachochytrium salamandrivorans]|uniref:DNA-directed RNA polymerase RBP11-like dimerisation domain-containing protein n=1 Tax=Batrachochytrium salamandrivorans TaxID=1357716 RepID=A0ABQ8FJD6_9FUNG|nr:hypothetical protein BASA60_010184 [Batrachochytrium salamandrivorans]KAH6576753.1 hypothetical protein BASA62_001204 [Batrachochytrium salamandrivorans]KAH6582663.1 hypothetical protein BASA61_008413 [Batrachochytrium salamandrivorans]KAH6597938.1 hypothetical protein BASA50_004093 [Batrachochytrium salamandrivorans]KAH9262040.1 hypothetical protein BASA82_000869 [Batrachochytrium salamandrivorans]
MAMVEPSVEGGTRGVPYISGPKIIVLATDSQDTSSATFCIRNEDHTLGNSLRYIIMKNPAVSFCGYSIPHPSEYQINLRIQTDGTTTAVDALHKGLDDLVDMMTHIKDTFTDRVKTGDYDIRDDADINAK